MDLQRNAPKTTLVVVAAVVVMVAMLSGLSEAQTGLPSCVQKLSPCLSYLNSTATPPATCCDPIKDAVNNEMTCLCTVYETPGLLSVIGTNLTQILRVTKSCGVNADPSICNATAPASAPPAVPGTPGSGDNGAGNIVTTGIFSLVFIWVLMLLH